MDTFKVGVEQGNYDEAAKENFAIKALSDAQEILSFDKIKPSLILFHEGEDREYSIIFTSKKEEDEYKDLLESRTTPMLVQNIVYWTNGVDKQEEKPTELNNYSIFTHKMFFKEIKEILNIKKPIINGESKMKILNIHAGIIDQEIVDILYKKRRRRNK